MKDDRIWEIDLLRTSAVILMIIYHFIFDLGEFCDYKINYNSFGWYLIGTSSGLIFIFTSGLSSGFSKNPVKRGVKVLLFAMIITLATYIFDKDMYIRFGILHFIGVSMIISPLFRRFKSISLFLISIIIVIIGIFIRNVEINSPYFLPLGITYWNFTTYDYFPMIPYFSTYIIGIITFNEFYTMKKSIFNFSISFKWIQWISRNSLRIYLVHQPIIIGILYLYKYLT